ncbi:MAG: M23 family metallopeptidase [Phenylobacterium sp.]|uniref:M23 family metallopeptidase n=1 Tax=Phenylobacterium sp. TaxID=1871053 RepID=UPI002733DD68|nr:M23 family metallopeptidase [Phenylobacterium sp.]MDP3749227.1 M23 family metallopeptidase [Phenylobacterium sp.]
MTRSVLPALLLGVLAACSPAGESPGEAAAEPPATPAVAARPVEGPRLSFPLACVVGETCEVQNHVDADPGPGVKDYRCGTQTYEKHGGVDIRLLDMAAQRRGVDVLVAAPGRVTRLRDGVADVSVKVAGAASVAGQECGNGVVVDHGGGWETQYCHLARGSIRVKQGDTVGAGQPIARVGLSGNTEYPHLHLSVRKAGVTVDPYRPDARPGTCDVASSGRGLWNAPAAKAVAYRPGAVLNTGFAGAPVTMESVEAGGVATPSADGPALVAYVRAINLQAGDVQSLSVRGPDGNALVQNTLAPLDRGKAQYVLYVGKRTPTGGWRSGRYMATYVVTRGGNPVLKRTFELAL